MGKTIAISSQRAERGEDGRRSRRRIFVEADAGDEAHGDFPRVAVPPAESEARDLKLVVAWTVAAILALALLLLAAAAFAHDDGRFAGSPLKAWFDQLASGKGLCCSFADGVSIEDVDWDTGGPNNGYRVRLNGQWIDVPPDAVVTAPNRFGAAMVWPYQDGAGRTRIRCFMPGAGT